jgi:hypothetical protein
MNQFWYLAVALALHETEEWNIHGWYVRNFCDLPERRTPTTIRFFLVFLSVAGFVWVGVAEGFGDAAAWIVLPLVALIVQNILQHIYWQFLFREYAPGIVTAVLLLTPLSGWIIYSTIARGMVASWYIVVLAVAIVPGLVETVNVRNRLTRAIQTIHRFSVWGVGKCGLSDNA